MRKFLAIAAVLSISACSTTREPGHDGVRIFGGGSASSSDVAKLKDQLAQNAKSSTAKAVVEEALAGEVKPGILVVGNVGSLRKLDVQDRPKFFQKSYAMNAEKWHPGSPSTMSESDFTSQVAGYTGIVVWSVPGVVSQRRIAAVREVDVEKIDFPGIRMANFMGATGDLVIASSNDDGVFFVDKVLCRDAAADYKTCASQYVRGNFDKNTGAELDSSFAPKSGGSRIDITTYHALPNF